MITILLLVVVPVVAVVLGTLVIVDIISRGPRRREVEALVHRLLTEAEMDAVTHLTLQAMRESARNHGNGFTRRPE